MIRLDGVKAVQKLIFNLGRWAHRAKWCAQIEFLAGLAVGPRLKRVMQVNRQF